MTDQVMEPLISVIIPTFNNVEVLKQCLESWERFAGHQPVEIIVIEDGCQDGTREYLTRLSETPWGRQKLRWFHEDDVHELVCTNRGLTEARAQLIIAWQKDMLVKSDWFIPELIATFKRYPEIGLLSLSRGLICLPLDEPIDRWEQVTDWRRLQSTIGKRPFNWFRLQEVDAVVRPWVVRRQCIEAVGLLDEAFRPTEWDEADLCFRIRQAGWKVAAHGYERLGAYYHLGSVTLTHSLSEQYKERVLRNAKLFYQRWEKIIFAEHSRPRDTWLRRTTVKGWKATIGQLQDFAVKRQSRLGRS